MRTIKSIEPFRNQQSPVVTDRVQCSVFSVKSADCSLTLLLNRNQGHMSRSAVSYQRARGMAC
jgi:hypothetical protein